MLTPMGDPLTPLGADPMHQMQFGRAVFDYGKNVGSEAPHQFLGEDRADPLHEPAAQIPLDSLGGGRRHGLQGRGFELKAVFLVPHPPSFGSQPLPGGHRRQRAHDRDVVPLPLGFYPQDTETALVAVEGDSLNQPRDLIGGGSAFGGRGIHEWVSFCHGGLVQFLREGRYVANVVDGKVNFYAGRGGTNR